MGKKKELAEMDVLDLLQSGKFDNLTIKEIRKLFKCNIKVDTSMRRIRLDIYTKFKPQFEYNQYPFNLYNQVREAPANRDVQMRDMPRPIRFNTHPFSLDEDIESFNDICNDSENDDVSDSNESDPFAEEKITIPPFHGISIMSLFNITQAFYKNKISLEEIKKVWSIGDTVSMSYMKGFPISYANARVIDLTIVDFCADTLSEPVNGHDKALLTMVFTERMDNNEFGKYLDDESCINPVVPYTNNVFTEARMFAKTHALRVTKVTTMYSDDATEITSQCKIFPLSIGELLGTPLDGYSEVNENRQYQLFSDIKSKSGFIGLSKYNTITRTCCKNDDGKYNPVYFEYRPTFYTSNANDARSTIVIGFCM